MREWISIAEYMHVNDQGGICQGIKKIFYLGLKYVILRLFYVENTTIKKLGLDYFWSLIFHNFCI